MIAGRIYRALLLAFPREFRDAHGAAMLEEFEAARLECGRRPLAHARLWGRAAADALRHGWGERRGSVEPLSDHSTRTTTMEHSDGFNGAERSKHVSGGWWRDARIGARRLRRSPGFTLVAAATLALGIGATSAIFSVVYHVLIEPLPFPDSGRLVGLYQVWEGKRDVFTSPNFIDLESRTKTLDSAAAYTTRGLTLTGAGDPARFIAAMVTGRFFKTLQSAPRLGRALERADNEAGSADVVVLGDGLWRSRFGADESIVGKPIMLNGRPTTVVGVMPAGFNWPFGAELWVPAAYTESFKVTSRGAWYLDAIARLKPGVSLEQATAEIEAIGRQLETEYPKHNARVGMTAYPLLDAIVGDSRRALLLLLGAVGFVLLIACVNVANLTLVRASSRETEFAVQLALGSGRWAIVRQLMVESLLVAGVGAVLGLALAASGVSALVSNAPAVIPRRDGITLNWLVMAFTGAVSIATALLFGLIPALQAGRRGIGTTLNERGRSGATGPAGRRIRSALVVAEVALAVTLLAGAGLLVRSFWHVLHVDPGFTVGNAVKFHLSLPQATYADDDRRRVFYDRIIDTLGAVPGVTGVGLVTYVPPTPQVFSLSFTVDGRPPVEPNNQPSLEIRVADVNYLSVMGVPIRRGRGFLPTDRPGSPTALLITERAAARFFPGEDPLGKHIKLGWSRNGTRIEGDVVGIVADVKSFGVERDAPPQLYVPVAQVAVETMSYVVRTGVPAATMFSAMREAVRGVDPSLPVNRISTLEEYVSNSLAERRFYMLLLASFAGVAVLLAAVGIFGVLSHLVAQRTREIGIRVALGANRHSVMVLVLRQAFWLAGGGVVIGVTGALGLSRYIRTLLFGLEPTDPATFVVVAAGLFSIALIAAFLPARRATTVDPITALRGD